jgi:MFS transporter, MHS family, proline/betaine transporter
MGEGQITDNAALAS